jgi:hypothetical protein
MDAHRLRSVIDLIIAEHRRLDIYQKLARIVDTLQQGASNPSAAADEQFRGALTELLAALRDSKVNDLVESDRRILARIDGKRFAGSGLAERVLEVANERPFLPARAKTMFAKLATELEQRYQLLSGVQAGLLDLNVTPLRWDDGAYELGILLPESVIKGDLQNLLGELKEWNQSLRDLLPVLTTRAVEVSLRTHSTERFELSVPLDRDGALALGVAVARIYEMFQKVQANRDRAVELEKQSYPSEIVGRITSYEHQLVSRELKAIKEELTQRNVRRGAGKRKEIDKLLDKGLRYLAIRIREGVEVEIVGPTAATEPGAAGAGHDPVTHHVRAALRAARQVKPAPAPEGKDDNRQTEPEAPRLPLSKIAEEADGTEGEKKAA